MPRVFLELYNYTDVWKQEKAELRQEFMQQVVAQVSAMPKEVIEILGYGFNDTDTDRRAPYDFFCVYRVADKATQRAFEKQVEGSGWYDYFEQVNICGDALTPSELFLGQAKLAEPPSRAQA